MPWTTPCRPPRNHRLASEVCQDPSRGYYIALRAYRNLRPVVLPLLNARIVDLLRAEQERQHCRVFTCCLMPDHLHFLASPCDEETSILQFVDWFKGRATSKSWKCGCEGKLSQPRHRDDVVRRDEDLGRWHCT